MALPVLLKFTITDAEIGDPCVRPNANRRSDPLTVSKLEAAKIAKAHGLSLADAAALAQFDNVKEADEAAELFSPNPQLSRADLVGMDPSTIEEMRVQGRLRDIMNPPPAGPEVGPGQLSRADTVGMSPEDLEQARADGKLRDVMGQSS